MSYTSPLKVKINLGIKKSKNIERIEIKLKEENRFLKEDNIMFELDGLKKQIKESDKCNRCELYQKLNDWLIDQETIPESYLSILNMGMSDSYSLVRFTALEPFEIHIRQAPLDVVEALFFNDKDSWVRGEAGFILALTENKSYIPLLQKKLIKSRGAERIHILMGLVTLGIKTYFEQLLKTFSYHNFQWFSVSVNLTASYIDCFNNNEQQKIFYKLKEIYQQTPNQQIGKINLIEHFFQDLGLTLLSKSSFD